MKCVCVCVHVCVVCARLVCACVCALAISPMAVYSSNVNEISLNIDGGCLCYC